MDTTEGNKLIAEFIELRGEFNEDENVIYLESDIDGKGVYSMDELKFHSSWDWLMPVVEKIESLTYINDNNETDYWFFKKGNHCVGFWLDTWGKPYQVKGVEDHTYSFRLQETLIQSTWLAVVEFIKWYNANK